MNKLVEKHMTENTRPVPPRPAQAVAPRITGRDPFEVYADLANPKNVIGTLLSFSKSIYVAGKDKTEIPEGSEFTAAVDLLMSGWVRWEDKKPVETVLVAVADGKPFPPRNQLGHDEESCWERDDNGKARDPWQRTDYLPLHDDASEQLYTFSVTSDGGRKAIGKLCREYVKHRRTGPSGYPVIAVKSDNYRHRDYGRVDISILEIIDWEPRDPFSGAMIDAGLGPLPPARPAEVATTVAQDMDDSIPF